MQFCKTVTLGLILAGPLAGCGFKQSAEAPAGAPSPMPQYAPAAPAQTEAVTADAKQAPEPAADGEEQPADPSTAPTPTRVEPNAAARLLVYHAEARVKTNDLAAAATRLAKLVRQSGGYVSASSETREDGEWRHETTVRVPPARFQALLTGLGGLGTVEEKKLSTDDVTAEHADVAARLRTKRAVEQRYVALLAKAQKIKDVLEVEEKIGEVREEIEATESRLKTLNDEVAYSTVTLTLYQPLTEPVPDLPVVSLGSRVVEAFYGGWELLTSLLVGAVAAWPLWILGGLGVWLWRRRKASRAAVSRSLPARSEA